MIEAFQHEPGQGLWYLRDTLTGVVVDRGPFIAHKTALRAVRQLNDKAEPWITVEVIPGEFASVSTAEVAERAVEKATLLPPSEEVEGWTARDSTEKWGEEGEGWRDLPEDGSIPEDFAKAVGVPMVELTGPADAPIAEVEAPQYASEGEPAVQCAPEVASPLRFSSAARQNWLEDAAQWCVARIKAAGGSPPETIRVSISWPYGGRATKRIGECWHAEASRDAHREVFISPVLDDNVDVVATLLHELCHASLGPDAKHGPQFKKLALAVGLEGKMTATTAGDALKVDIGGFITSHGDYPAKGLDATTGRPTPKQTTRLLKVECPHCGYIARTTRSWLDRAGAPICPTDEVPMEEAD